MVPRPPTKVHSTTLVASENPKICGDTKLVRCTYSAPAKPASAPPTVNAQILIWTVL